MNDRHGVNKRCRTPVRRDNCQAAHRYQVRHGKHGGKARGALAGTGAWQVHHDGAGRVQLMAHEQFAKIEILGDDQTILGLGERHQILIVGAAVRFSGVADVVASGAKRLDDRPWA
jgi:hypothetical protein